MTQKEGTVTDRRWRDMGRFVCFILLTTAGMATIAAAVLAEPLTVYFLDRDLIAQQEQRLAELHQVQADQELLLANLDKPTVIERVAINEFGYKPLEAFLGEPGGELGPVSPELAQALESLEQKETARLRREQLWAQALAERPREQMLLFILGGGLTVVGMTFFYKRS